MCTGMELQILGAVASAGFQMQQASQQKRAAQEARDAEIEAAYRNAQLEYIEAERQVEEERQKAISEESDRIRQAKSELGSIRALGQGLSDTSLGSLLFESDYVAGVDINRIEDNLSSFVDQKESEKKAAYVDAENTAKGATNKANSTVAQANANMVGAGLGAVNTGLNIKATADYRAETLEIARNKQ